MENQEFHLSNYDVEARLRRLSTHQVEALEAAFSKLSERKSRFERIENEELLPLFLLPLAEFGFSTVQIVKIVEKIPNEFPLDHREIYFDFRLAIWIKHIEPPSVANILDECIYTAASKSDGLTYLKLQWRDFLVRHNAQ